MAARSRPTRTTTASPTLHDTCPAVSRPTQTDTDADTLGNPCDADDDNDRLTDAQETAGGTDPPLPDTDGDAVGDEQQLPGGVQRRPGRRGRRRRQGDACDHPAPSAPSAAGHRAAIPATLRPRAMTPCPRSAPQSPRQYSETVAPVEQPAIRPGRRRRPSPRPPSSGKVTVRLRGLNKDVPAASRGTEIQVGAIVDTTEGAVVLTSALPDGRVRERALLRRPLRLSPGAAPTA